MRKSLIVRLRTSRLRRFVAAATVVAYLILCTGLPVPWLDCHAAPVGDPAAAAYPCMAHRCGCRSAEQCWKSCCCMSDLEKRLWAERNGVALPDYLQAMPQADAGDSVHRVAEPKGNCCRQASGRSPQRPVAKACGRCPSKAETNHAGEGCEQAVAQPSACRIAANAACLPSQSSPEAANTAADSHAEQVAGEIEWVSLLSAQRCSGGATDMWYGGPTSLPATTCLVSLSRLDRVRPFLPAVELATESRRSFPPLRPPRFG